MNLSKQFLGANEVDESKIRLGNNAALRSRNAANTGDVNLIKLNGSDQIMFGDVAMPGWQKVTFTFSQFSDPSTTKDLTILTIPPGHYVSQFFIKSTASFTGGAVSAVALTTGIDSGTGLTSGYDLFTAPTGSAFVNFIDVSGALDFSAPHNIQAEVISTGDNLDQLTAGSFDFYYVIKNLNADAEIGAPGTSNGCKVFPPDLTMSGLTQILFGTPDREFDTGNYVQSANTFTLSASGIYMIAAAAKGAAGTLDYDQIGYKINGGPFRVLSEEFSTNALGSIALKLNGLTVELLGPGDQITFWAQSGSDTGPFTEIECSVTALIGGFGLADGASRALDDLAPTSINQSLIPQSTGGSQNLGSNTNYWGESYLNILGDAAGTTTINAFNRVLSDETGQTSLEWGTSRRLTNAANQVVFEWDVGGEVWFNKQTNVAPTVALRWLAQDGNHAYGLIGPVTGGATNVTWALPNADGTSGQVLTTDGSAILSWTTPSGGGPGVDATARHLIDPSSNVILDWSNVAEPVMTGQWVPLTDNTLHFGGSGHLFAGIWAYTLIDTASAVSVDIVGRQLKASGNAQLDWSTNGTILINAVPTPNTDIVTDLGKVGQRWSTAWATGVNSGSADLTLTSHSTAMTLGSSSLDVGNRAVQNLVDPTNAQDATTKQWVHDHTTYWEKVTLSYTAFSAAATSKGLGGIGFNSGGIGRVIMGVIIKQSTAFTGTGITGCTISLSGQSWSSTSHDIHAAVSNSSITNTAFFAMDGYSNVYTITASVASTGANLDQLTQGSVDIWILSSKAP